MPSDNSNTILADIQTLHALQILRDIQAAKLKAIDADVARAEESILAAMTAAGVSTIGDAGIIARIDVQRVYKAEDWTTLYERIRATSEFDLLHKRLSITALAEREKAGDLPRGVVAVPLPKLKIVTMVERGR